MLTNHAEDTLQTGLPTHQAAVQLEYSGLLYCAVLYSTLDLDLARYYSCTTVGIDLDTSTKNHFL